MSIRIYGYAGCTTVKKARDWAEGAGLEVEYQHFSAVPALEREIAAWVERAGIDAVFNARAQTLRKLPANEQAAITASQDAKIAAMAAEPRLIKRPVGTDGATVLTGFDPHAWKGAFG
ncbi:arsenate reductase family protein [Oricola sp.]|uniref:arsenate reductase family protein n=1 Tax=Oricola sp. TaxID=1979950 RepID=UPI003BACC1CF